MTRPHRGAAGHASVSSCALSRALRSRGLERFCSKPCSPVRRSTKVCLMMPAVGRQPAGLEPAPTKI